ncbi:MAG: type II toxin-antitoxin system death-on-curing family toxin [Candidatus Sumerlaeota bacterium]|nr:type II toxin-antitoxin system death-on-curing family toxin [Candidatus Sumerlaeota bacterium]
MPDFLSLDDVLRIHRDEIEHYGGSQGIRDQGLLESALAMPQAGFGDQYFHADIYEMAAAYLFSIVQNHPFLDGNKRTGAMSAHEFLWLNEVSLEPREKDFENLVRKVAEGAAGKADLAEFLRSNSRE